MKNLVYILLSCTILAVTGCDKPKPTEHPAPFPEKISLNVPANFPPVSVPERNPLTKEGVLLGRKLFFDPVLSGNNQLSCSSCHLPEKAFADNEIVADNGISGKKLLRHTPAIINIAWAGGLFWDGGAKDIESLNFAPITNPDEMGQNLSELVKELKQMPAYQPLFQAAFPGEEISSANISRALAQFQRTLISANSRYDKYVRKESGGNLNSQELEGLALFNQHCRSCHSTDLFTDNSYHNNGLDNSFSNDHEEIAFGRGRVTLNPTDIGKFKTPTLRNIALTAPYMHDGRFSTLEQVLGHYRSGVKYSSTLDTTLIKVGKAGIQLTGDESQKIILFLQTLTDPGFTQNPDYKQLP